MNLQFRGFLLRPWNAGFWDFNGNITAAQIQSVYHITENTMRRLFHLVTVLLLVVLLVSCADATPEPVEGMIHPGDEIDGMVFTTDDQFDFSIERHAYCGFEPVEETDTTFSQACSASPGDHVFFGNCFGIGRDSLEDLDNTWQSLKSEFTFDGQAINLPAFGTLDFEIPDTDLKARVWNLKVENITPGTHTIQCMYEEGGESGTTTLVFTISEQPETFPTLSSEVFLAFFPIPQKKQIIIIFCMFRASTAWIRIKSGRCSSTFMVWISCIPAWMFLRNRLLLTIWKARMISPLSS